MRLGTTRQLNDDVLVYKFFHKKTEAVPEGRLVWCLDGGEVLQDTFLPYDDIPLQRMVADEMIGSTYGFSPLNSLMPLQEALNVAYSTITTNQYTNGVQVIVAEDGTDVNPQDLGRGMVMITYPRDGKPPQGMNFTNTPAEVFRYKDEIVREMEALIGVSDISRGQQQRTMSGSSMALIASMTAQNQGPFQRNYASLVGRVGTDLLKMISRFADTPRTIAIMGKHNSGQTTFIGTEDLQDFDEVIVDLGNPLTRSYAGRMEIGTQLLDRGAVTLDQYFEFITSGNLEVLYEGPREEVNFVRLENEHLMDGKTDVNVHPLHNHELHIAYHRRLIMLPHIAFPKDQNGIAVLKNIQDHILAHQEMIASQQQPVPDQKQTPDQVIEKQKQQSKAEGDLPKTNETGISPPNAPAVDQAKEAGTSLPTMPVIAGTNTRYPG